MATLMDQETQLFLGRGEVPEYLSLHLANRHGLIAGATGTGKSVSLQLLAEGFSRVGVPVFMADVKGDLAGLSQPGSPNPKINERLELLGLEALSFRGNPVCFWDLAGEHGHPVRTTISDMGPLLLGRLLELNDTQQGVLNLTFKLADDEGLLLLDLKDLRAMLAYVAENASDLTSTYGNVSKASVGAIQRQLLSLEQQGGDHFFGEPALDLADLIRTNRQGHGYINILAADQLIHRPRLYATFLLWLLSELFEQLPEVGDLPQPKLVFFFDEAHLLFNDAPKALVDKVEQVVRLIRSKGVGVYFVTQSPSDVPDTVLAQLGNRIQHALRAFTPRDQKAVRVAAETFRPNPKLNTAQAIQELAVGEALVSTLEGRGTPTPVQRIFICPPGSRIGPVTAEERQAVIRLSGLHGHYEQSIDRESAYEILQGKAVTRETEAAAAGNGSPKGRTQDTVPAKPPTPQRDTVVTALAKSVARSIGSNLGRQIVRGILGSLFKGR